MCVCCTVAVVAFVVDVDVAVAPLRIMLICMHAKCVALYLALLFFIFHSPSLLMSPCPYSA